MSFSILSTYKNLVVYLAFILIYLLPPLALAHTWSTKRADAHAPIGVMGDHTHKSGEWMLSYRFMSMNMEDNRIHSNRISTQAVLDQFMVAPLKMTMDMHMLGVMYAPSNNLTFMAMLPYIEKKMDHIHRNGQSFRTQAKGIGDASVGGLYQLYSNQKQKLHINLGVSLATGATDKRDRILVNPNAKLPYPMQLGSGTYDLDFGMTYQYQAPSWSGGTQFIYTSRSGSNDESYRLGDEFNITAWVAKLLNAHTSVSLRLNQYEWHNIKGEDAELSPSTVPTANPDLRAGDRTEIGVGINYFFTKSALKGQRIALEYISPVRQSLKGPQLEADPSIILGWQLAFN